MMKKKLTASMLLSLLAGSAAVYAENHNPKIVVGIMVDQLRTDYIEQLRSQFSDNGFNRLIRDGVYIQNVDFHNSVSDSPSGAAVIYTGSWPLTNGVAGAEVIDAATRRAVPVLSDASATQLNYSPENLRVSTIADEYYITNGNLSKIYSIGGDPQTAVVMGGHAGNAAVWFDINTGKWTTSKYYGTLPPVVANRNRISPFSSKIGSSIWTPLHPADYYQDSGTWNNADFRYTFPGGTKDSYTRFKNSALFNTEVTETAIDYLNTKQSGLLSLEYSLAPLNSDFDGDNRPELIDSYIRLDSELGKLLDSIDKNFGEGNSIVFIASTGYANEPEIPENNARIPSGEITLRQVESLLNSYLSATYGNADYVSDIRKGKIYLNTKETERKGLNTKQLRAEIKDFLLKMSGIREVVTIDEILISEGLKAKELSLGVDAKNPADLYVYFAPGWTVTNDIAYPSVTEKVRLGSPATPTFILSPDLEPQIIYTTVDATAIAPTLASIMRIRSPNGADSKPLSLERKNSLNRK